VLLESYANACADFISENANADHPLEEDFPRWNTSLPTLSPYPDDDEGWRAIDRRLASRVLNLPNRIHVSQNTVVSTIQFNEDELGETLDEEAAARGLEAWTVAVELRRTHNVEAVDPVWDFPKMLKETLRNAQQKKEQNRESHARMWQLISTDADPSKPVVDKSVQSEPDRPT
jgi:hypothetical protein